MVLVRVTFSCRVLCAIPSVVVPGLERAHSVDGRAPVDTQQSKPWYRAFLGFLKVFVLVIYGTQEQLMLSTFVSGFFFARRVGRRSGADIFDVMPMHSQ